MMTNKQLKNIVALILILSSCFQVNGQSNDHLSSYPENLQEKIVLETERGTYVSGETMWFSAQYFINGHKPEKQISKILYIELINSQADPVIQQKVKIRNNAANGMIEIPGEVPTGNYILRAYTKYQRNQSHYGFSYLHMYILNPSVPPENNEQSNEMDVRVYFDGYDPAKPDRSRYVLYLTNPQLVDSIKVLNSNDSLVKEIKQKNNHFLRLSFKADSANTYRIITYLKNGSSLERPFPRQKSVTFFHVAGYPDFELQVCHNQLQGELQGEVQVEIYGSSLKRTYTKTVDLKDDLVTLPDASIRDGLQYLTLKDKETNQLIALKSFYIIPERKQHLNLQLDKTTFNKREQVNLTIAPLKGGELHNITVSAVRQGTGQNNQSVHQAFALSNPWLLDSFLSSMENPSHFKNEISAALRVYDERYGKEILQEINKNYDTLKHLPEIKDITVSGVLKDNNTGEPVAGKQVYGSVLFNNPQFHIYETNSDGEFVFHLNDLQGIQDIFLCPLKSNGASDDYEILINREFDSRQLQITDTPFPFSREEKALIEEIYLNYQLHLAFNESAVSGEKISESRRFYHLFGKERISRNLDDYVSLDEMWDVLYEVVPHVRPVKNKDGYKLKIMNDESWVLPGNPLVLLDNVPIFDVGKIMDIHPAQVEKIEVIDRTYLLGAYAINGVVLITTKTDNFAGVSFPKSSVFAEYLTTEPLKSFHSKTYSATSNELTSRPDFRNVLLWNQDIELNDKTEELTFYTSDRSGDYEIIVKGTSISGEKVYQKKRIEVR